ncbi:MAG: chromate transporter [Erysipelotrichaceae bacterium]|nr:chromate transporter [Erysipelotrichaceae bacterium]
MSKSKESHRLLNLFLTFLKIGILTFGGGYAMIPIIEKEVVEKQKWIDQSEMFDILSISQSTPGPVSVNTATFVGYRLAGFWGSFFATLGLVTPSFFIILLISFFYQTFLSWEIVSATFLGIRAGVVILLIDATIRLKKMMKLTPLTIAMFLITFLTISASFFFNLDLSIGSFKISLSIILIIVGIIIGLVTTSLTKGEQKQ